jgi:hypothetical protein
VYLVFPVHFFLFLFTPREAFALIGLERKKAILAKGFMCSVSPVIIGVHNWKDVQNQAKFWFNWLPLCIARGSGTRPA